MAPPTLKPNQKVLCIDDSGFQPQYNEILPVAGVKYTIRNVIANPDAPGQCIRLKEIKNARYQYSVGVDECAFKASRFQRTN